VYPHLVADKGVERRVLASEAGLWFVLSKSKTRAGGRDGRAGVRDGVVVCPQLV